MKDPDAVIVKQMTYEECLTKDRIVLKKYIIAKMAELNIFPNNCSESIKYEIFDKIEKKLMHCHKNQLVDIIGRSENEIWWICNDMKHSMLKEVVNSFNDDDIKDVGGESDSDITDESDTDSDDGGTSHPIDFRRKLTRGRKSHSLKLN